MNIILKFLITLVFVSIMALLAKVILRPETIIKISPKISYSFDYSNAFHSQTDEIKWLTENDNAMTWFSYAIRRLNYTALENQLHNIYDQQLIWRTNDFPPLHWYQSENDTISIAVAIYLMGPALSHLEPGIPHSYYLACGNGLITMFLFSKGAHCSLRHQYRYIGWNYICYVYSFFYEMDRTARVRGKFGVTQMVAFVLVSTMFSIIILVMGCLNYITMGRVMQKVDAGPTLYHRFEIGCGIIIAVFSLIRDQDISVIANLLKYIFTGSCLSPQTITAWSCVHIMLINQLNDVGIIALALLAKDRYQAFADPIESMAAEKRPGRRLAAASMMVATSTGIRLVAECLQQYKIWSAVATIVGTGIGDFIRTTYLSVCFYTTIRCSIGITVKILITKKSKKSIAYKNEEQDDRLRRTAALTLQTCILSSLTILTSGFAAFISFLISAMKLANCYDAADLLQNIYVSYFCAVQYFVGVVCSNVVFIVHCYYSMLYREAMYETHAALKIGSKKIFNTICRLKFKTNSVQPHEEL